VVPIAPQHVPRFRNLSLVTVSIDPDPQHHEPCEDEHDREQAEEASHAATLAAINRKALTDSPFAAQSLSRGSQRRAFAEGSIHGTGRVLPVRVTPASIAACAALLTSCGESEVTDNMTASSARTPGGHLSRQVAQILRTAFGPANAGTVFSSPWFSEIRRVEATDDGRVKVHTGFTADADGLEWASKICDEVSVLGGAVPGTTQLLITGRGAAGGNLPTWRCLENRDFAGQVPSQSAVLLGTRGHRRSP
jgi:hypothetical protein